MTSSSNPAVIANSNPIVRRRTRREILQILAGIGTVLAAPCVAQVHPMYRHLMNPESLQGASAKVTTSDWAPALLDSHQNEILIALTEGIVPGSSKAQVNRIIDVLLTVETAENRQKLAAALAALDADSNKRFSQPITRLTPPQMSVLLEACSTANPG